MNFARANSLAVVVSGGERLRAGFPPVPREGSNPSTSTTVNSAPLMALTTNRA